MAGIVKRGGIIAGPMNEENQRTNPPAAAPAAREDEVPVTKPSRRDSSQQRAKPAKPAEPDVDPRTD